MSTKTFARIVSLSVQDVFHSSVDNQLKAVVEVENESDFAHSVQIVFRGYVRDDKQLIYEFLHEQVWILIEAKGNAQTEVSVDVWLPRFPPTMRISETLRVEYAVRGTVDPWYQNNYVEKIFVVDRTLTLKMPHAACYSTKIMVNECVGHTGWAHRVCKPINGEMWSEKGAYSHGETIQLKWKLRHQSKIENVKVFLRQAVEYRIPDPGHQMMIKADHKTVASADVSMNKQEEEQGCELTVPSDIATTMQMTLWNVLSINYQLLVQVKTAAHRDLVDLMFPIIITSQPVQGQGVRNTKSSQQSENLFVRAMDMDDDSEDDDDVDSDLENEEPTADRDYSIDIEKLEIKTEKNGSLRDAYAKVYFIVNSNKPRPLRNMRLLLEGEVRAGAVWYEFIRFKAIISTHTNTSFSPGEHFVKVSLPFRDSQYDTNILAPSLGDDIRYICRATMVSWRKNVVHFEKDAFVDRFVDTWAKEEFKGAHVEQIGAYGISMRQRAFQRGKHVFVTVTGNVRSVRLELLQQRRVRIPGLGDENSYCHERTVAARAPVDDRMLWPEEWSIPIPANVPPCIEISYWNVLVLHYALVVIITLEDGHEHRHVVPIWIGCTDDRLTAPEPPKKMDDIQMRSPSPEEIPEFEVIKPEETHIQPYWVERYNNHTYSYDAN